MNQDAIELDAKVSSLAGRLTNVAKLQATINVNESMLVDGLTEEQKATISATLEQSNQQIATEWSALREQQREAEQNMLDAGNHLRGLVSGPEVSLASHVADAAATAHSLVSEERDALLQALLGAEEAKQQAQLQASQAKAAMEESKTECEAKLLRADNRSKTLDDQLEKEIQRRRDAENTAEGLRDTLRQSLAAAASSSAKADAEREEALLSSEERATRDQRHLQQSVQALEVFRSQEGARALLQVSATPTSQEHVAGDLVALAATMERERLNAKIRAAEDDAAAAHMAVAELQTSTQSQLSLMQNQLTRRDHDQHELESALQKSKEFAQSLNEQLSASQMALTAAREELLVKTASWEAELAAARVIIQEQDLTVTQAKQAPLEAAREAARAAAESKRAAALQAQLQKTTSALGVAEAECSRQALRADNLQDELARQVAQHTKEKERDQEQHSREGRQLRAQLAAMAGNQQYMEKALDRARAENDRAADGAMKAVEAERERFRLQLAEAQAARADALHRVKEAERDALATRLQLTGEAKLQVAAVSANEKAQKEAEEAESLRARVMAAEEAARTAEQRAVSRVTEMTTRTEKELASLSAQVSEREGLLTEERRAKRVLQEELSALRAQTEQAARAAQDRVDQIQAQEAALRVKVEELQGVKQHNTEMLHQVRASEEKLAVLMNQLSQAKADKAVLQGRLNELQEAPSGRNFPLSAGALVSADQAVGDMLKVRSALARVEAEKLHCQHQLEASEARVASMCTSASDLQDMVRRAEDKVRHLEAELAEVRSGMSASLESAKLEVDRHRGEAERSVTVQMLAVKEETALAAMSHEEERVQLQKSLEEARRRVDHLQLHAHLQSSSQVLEVMEHAGLKCNICMRFFSDPNSLQGCSHTFCRTCISPILLEPPAYCPQCKVPARRQDLIPNPALGKVAAYAQSIVEFNSKVLEGKENDGKSSLNV